METIRSLMTLAAFSSFVGILWWAYAPGRKEQLESIGRSILEEEA